MAQPFEAPVSTFWAVVRASESLTDADFSKTSSSSFTQEEKTNTETAAVSRMENIFFIFIAISG